MQNDKFAPDGTIVEGLREVRDALQSKNPWILLNFLAGPDTRLGDRKPIDLRLGQRIRFSRRRGACQARIDVKTLLESRTTGVEQMEMMMASRRLPS